MEKKDKRAISLDAGHLRNEEDVSGATPNISQLRKRFELGGDSNSTTQPSFRAFARTTPPPVANDEGTPESTPDSTSRGRNGRPTIPTPRPLISLGAIPRRLVDENEMMSLPLDHRAAFLLMSIDGRTPIRSLVDVTGMQPEEVLVLVERLVELKAVALL